MWLLSYVSPEHIFYILFDLFLSSGTFYVCQFLPVLVVASLASNIYILSDYNVFLHQTSICQECTNPLLEHWHKTRHNSHHDWKAAAKYRKQPFLVAGVSPRK